MQISPQLKKIIIIVVVIVSLVGVVATGVAVTRSIFSQASETSKDTTPAVDKLAPPKAPGKNATPAATPTPIKKEPPPPAGPPPSTPSATPPVATEENGWTVLGAGNVDAVLSFSTDNKNLYADFESLNFSSVSSIDYSLAYETDANVARLVKGTVTPVSGQIPRKVVALWTCSGTTCVYDTGPHNFVFRILIKTNGGLTVNLKTYSLAQIPTANGLFTP